MKKYPLVTIIIPLYVITDRFFLDFKRYDELRYPHIEILVVSDKKVVLPKLKKFPVTLLLTRRRKTGPAEKRDIALKKAKGEICAFIDDDAYPDPDWVRNSVKDFQKENIAAVGGPGLTPPEDSYWEQLTGLVYSSFFCGGFAQYRFVKGKRRYVVDYPAYNLLIHTDILRKVGGYGSYFYGGEDTFVCLKLVKAGYKILYNPKVVVYHHRRPLFKSYLKQIANVGVHRGYFAKKFPETSRTVSYFIPSILAIGFSLFVLGALFNSIIRFYFIILLLAFLLLASGSIVRKAGIINSFLAGVGIILTHIVYGWSFIRGLLTRELTH